MKKLTSILAVLLICLLWINLGFPQSYANYPPTADKVLQPDGSIISIIGATTIAPASAARAQLYSTMPLQAAKYLMPDGSIINGVPITTTVTGTPTAGYCIKVNAQGGLVYGGCIASGDSPTFSNIVTTTSISLPIQADGTLSGSPVIICLNDSATRNAYCFKAYPTVIR